MPHTSSRFRIRTSCGRAAFASIRPRAATFPRPPDRWQETARLGEGRNDYNTEFGPANVALYEIAVAVDLGDAGRALRAAATVETTGRSAERRARMLIDVARAHTQRRQVLEAVGVRREAEEITPEQVRSPELVRQLVSDLLTMQDPPASELRELSERLGVTKVHDS